MITPNFAAFILAALTILLLIVIPMLDGSKRFSKFISLRYTLVSIALIASVGCILDFSHLAESSRNIVLMGGLILVGIFVIVRSVEKIISTGKNVEWSVKKGDTTLTVKSDEGNHQGRKLINENNSSTSTCSNNDCVSEDTECVSDQEES